MFSIFYCISLLFANIFACKFGDKVMRNNEEWIEKNVFMMKCTIMDNGSWKTEVVACITPNGARIPINQSEIEGRSQWTCTVTPDGKITMQQGPNPNAKCDGYDVGDIWQEKSFEFQCMRGGIPKLLACVGENGERIPIGQSREINGYDMKCEQFDNGTIIMKGQRIGASESMNGHAPTMCLDSKGNQHEIDSSWIENERFNKTCTSTGRILIQSCVTQDGHQVAIDSELIRGNTKYVCEKTKDGAVRYASGPAEE